MSTYPARLAFAGFISMALASACEFPTGQSLLPNGPGPQPGSVVIGEDPPVPQAQPAEVRPNPTAPPSEDGQPLGWTQAPELTQVKVWSNRDSAQIIVPAVEGARDYRAFRVPAGAKVTPSGSGQRVEGTTLFCAGYRQRNAKAGGALELLRVVEVADLEGPTDLVVEALDGPCPFTGVRGTQHVDLEVTSSEVPAQDRVPFSIFTETEIRERYGSLVVNGHGPGASLAAQAPSSTPKVLARTTIRVTPKDRSMPALGTFFDDFRENDPPVFAGPADDGRRANKKGRRYVNSNWEFFFFNDEQGQVFIDQGQLHMVLPDWEQDVFATALAVPRLPAQLSDTSYLHVSFEVPSNSTARRYWWMSLCGADAPGETFSPNGELQGTWVQTPFFYQADGKNPSVQGWNCLQFFPRDGSPFDLAPTNQRPESDIRVMVNRPNAPDRDNVVNVSPAQYRSSTEKPGWFRQMDANGKLTGVMLDDQLFVGQRTRFDAYIRRDRLVLFVNGEQRLCNDFPSHKLTMAEAAVGFGQVLYHSTAERVEFSRSYNDRTGQHYYLNNAPYLDARNWDNLGFEENLGAPSTFDEARCYTHSD